MSKRERLRRQLRALPADADMQDVQTLLERFGFELIRTRGSHQIFEYRWTIEDYLSLPYTLEIIPDGDAWFVSVKELPGCITEVDEWDEILPAVEDAKYLWIELALQRGRPVPEPQGVPAH